MKKNITRRLTTALLAAVMCVSMAACGSKTDDTKTDGTGDADGAKKYTIGVCQLVTHDALDAATQGFIDAVKDKLGAERRQRPERLHHHRQHLRVEEGRPDHGQRHTGAAGCL